MDVFHFKVAEFFPAQGMVEEGREKARSRLLQCWLDPVLKECARAGGRPRPASSLVTFDFWSLNAFHRIVVTAFDSPQMFE